LIYDTYKTFVTNEINEMFDAYIKSIEEEQDDRARGKVVLMIRQTEGGTRSGQPIDGLLLGTRQNLRGLLR